MVSKRIAIILARGGSKRLPRKNILDFGGKPLLAWSVIAAIESNLFDRVLVSTDDVEIAEIGRRYGAEVPFLRLTNADDISSASDATCTALLQAETFWQTKFDTVAQLMANCPLRTQENICQGISAFEQSSALSQISCFRFGWMNPWWAVKLKDGGEPERLFPEAIKVRSQDLPPLYCPSGALWIAQRDALLKFKSYYMKGHRFEPMHWISAMDIDDEADFVMAKMCLELRNIIKG
jgi:CMP-N-acetylneuraminic acid synthetase